MLHTILHEIATHCTYDSISDYSFPLKNVMSLCHLVQSPVEGCLGPAKGLGKKINHFRCIILFSDVSSVTNNKHIIQMSIRIWHGHLVMFSYLSHMLSYDNWLSHMSHI